MVQKSMAEQLNIASNTRERIRRAVATTALTLSVANLLSVSDSSAEPHSYFDLPVIDEGWSADNLSKIKAAYRMNENNKFEADFDMLPAPYSEALDNALHNPIVQYAISHGDVNYLGVTQSTPNVNFITQISEKEAHDNATFEITNESPTKRINLYVTDGKGNPEQRVFTDSWMMQLAVMHEAIHGINSDWFDAFIKENKSDSESMSKFTALKEACLPVGTWLYAAAMRKYGVKAKDYENDSDLVDCNINLSFTDLDLGEESFRCIDEGHMIQDMRGLDYTPPGGHAYDNPTELASSITTILILNPNYIKNCFVSQNPEEAAIIKEYIKATLELSFSENNGLETLLRKNEFTSEALDYLMKSV